MQRMIASPDTSSQLKAKIFSARVYGGCKHKHGGKLRQSFMLTLRQLAVLMTQPGVDVASVAQPHHIEEIRLAAKKYRVPSALVDRALHGGPVQ